MNAALGADNLVLEPNTPAGPLPSCARYMANNSAMTVDDRKGKAGVDQIYIDGIKLGFLRVDEDAPSWRKTSDANVSIYGL